MIYFDEQYVDLEEFKKTLENYYNYIQMNFNFSKNIVSKKNISKSDLKYLEFLFHECEHLCSFIDIVDDKIKEKYNNLYHSIFLMLSRCLYKFNY